MNRTYNFNSANGNGSNHSSIANDSRLGAVVFCALLAVIPLSAIPYGSADPWWEAAFECVVFLIAIISIVEIAIDRNLRSIPLGMVLPLIALIIFAFVQTISRGSVASSVGGNQLWRTLSADPFQTRLWAFKVLALVLMGLMLSRYTSNTRRLRALISVILLIGVASALFGVFRQTIQRHDGFFFLGRLMVGKGYAQFIGRNQFAFLAEMTLGTALGLLVARDVRKETKLIYLAASVVLWTALILSISRGAILAMLCQLLFLAVAWAMTGRTPKAVSRPNDLASRIKDSWALRVVLLGGLLAAIVVGTIWMGGDPLANRMETAEAEMTPHANLRTGTSRVEIWRCTLSMIRDHPITGVGFGGYWIAIPQYHQASGEATPQEAHNDYLELLASGGVIGLLLGACFVVAFARQARLVWKSSRGFRKGAALGALTGIFGVAIHSLADFGLHNLTNATIFTALVVVATVNIKADDLSASGKS